MTVNHGELHGGVHEDAHQGAVNEDAHRHQEHRGHHGAAALGHNAASGTIKSISGTTFVLTTEQGELNVTTSADTNYHGLSRRQAREAGYQDLAVVNTFAGLKVGQPVGVIGERQDANRLAAKRVHIRTP